MDGNSFRNLIEAYSEVYTQVDESIASASTIDRLRSSSTPVKNETESKPVEAPKPQLSARAQAINSGNSPLSRDPRARGGFDPRFDKKPASPAPTAAPKPTDGGTAVRTPNSGGSSSSSSGSSGGLLGTLDKAARETAGKVGGVLGREKAGKMPGANVPILGDVIKNEGERRGRAQGQGMYDKAKETLGGLLKQDYEYDMFDIILEYLVVEGYAETNKSAIVIMANMSEEWRQSIIEAIGIVGPPAKAIDAIPGVRAARNWASDAVKASDYSQSEKINKTASGRVIPQGVNPRNAVDASPSTSAAKPAKP